MNDELVVLVITDGVITEVYSCNSNQKIFIVAKDTKAGFDTLNEIVWPEHQFDDERVAELLGIKLEDSAE